MQILNPALDLDRFFVQLMDARERILLLDYDGTLAPFHARPERANPYPRVAAIIKQIVERASTRVVVVSGRRLADLRGPLARIRHTEVWGEDGWQRRTADGAHHAYRPASGAQRRLQIADARARRLGMSGARVERKVASVAVHWRGMAGAAAAAVRDKLAQSWCDLGGDQLELLAFDGGMELRARGRNKGAAVTAVLAECSSDAAVAYMGDDTTDEEAFAALKDRGIAVLVCGERRDSGADLRLAPPDELIAFFEKWLAAGEAR